METKKCNKCGGPMVGTLLLTSTYWECTTCAKAKAPMSTTSSVSAKDIKVSANGFKSLAQLASMVKATGKTGLVPFQVEVRNPKGKNYGKKYNIQAWDQASGKFVGIDSSGKQVSLNPSLKLY